MAAEQNEIMRSLGRLEEGVRQLRADFDSATASRSKIHDKIDHLESTIVIAGHAAAQTRDRIDAVEKALHDDIKPTTDEFKRMKLAGLGVIGFVGVAAATFGASLSPMISAIREWLS